MTRCGDFCWSIRRELWENRSIWIAPLALAALIVAGFLFTANHWSPAFRARHPVAALMPYGLAASAILFSGWLVGVFYSLDALNGERRDRSILFWKSMPVSDVTTVLAKVAVPLLVIPIVTIAIALAAQAIMLVGSMAILSTRGIDPLLPWTLVPWPTTTVALLYGMAAHALWFAPIFGYLLLVSACVRRAAFLWAVMPFFAAAAVEAIAFGSTNVASLLKYRFLGGMQAFKPDAMKDPITQLSQLDPVRFLTLPGLWLGVAFAIICIAAAIRLRRYREPI